MMNIYKFSVEKRGKRKPLGCCCRLHGMVHAHALVNSLFDEIDGCVLIHRVERCACGGRGGWGGGGSGVFWLGGRWCLGVPANAIDARPPRSSGVLVLSVPPSFSPTRCGSVGARSVRMHATRTDRVSDGRGGQGWRYLRQRQPAQRTPRALSAWCVCVRVCFWLRVLLQSPYSCYSWGGGGPVQYRTGTSGRLRGLAAWKVLLTVLRCCNLQGFGWLRSGAGGQALLHVHGYR